MLTLTAEVDLERENLALREELRRARAELRRVDQLKRDFISVAAHELRNPLAILLGYTRILENESTGSIRDRAETVALNALRLKNLIDVIVTLQQLDSGELALRFEPIQVASIVEDAVESRQREITDKSLQVESQVNEELFVRGDRERLGIILANILANAIKYSPRGEQISVHAASESSRVILGVRDCGPGIPPEEQPRIFDRFYQVGDPHARRQNGLGLGLAVSKALVELHGGRIWVESVPNQGSTFNVSLPRIAPNGQGTLGSLSGSVIF